MKRYPRPLTPRKHPPNLDDMPITIFRQLAGAQSNERYAWLCDDIWELPTQLRALAAWLSQQEDLEPGDYAADIGYSVREGATGGGEKMSREMISDLHRLGMEVHFSEYHLVDLGNEQTGDEGEV